MGGQMIAGIIIGRKGGQKFEGKNMVIVGGKPMSQHVMDKALASKYIDEVYVTTNDENLMMLGVERGCTLIKRPEELATKEALAEDVFVHALAEIRKKHDPELLALFLCNEMSTRSHFSNYI